MGKKVFVCTVLITCIYILKSVAIIFCITNVGNTVRLVICHKRVVLADEVLIVVKLYRAAEIVFNNVKVSVFLAVYTDRAVKKNYTVTPASRSTQWGYLATVTEYMVCQ